MTAVLPGSGPALAAALRPTSIAVVGASENPNKVGGRPLHYLSRFGYRGAVYPINPNRRQVQGLHSYPDLASLPEAPDLAVIALPAAQAPAAVDACAAARVKAAIVIAGGFGETTNPAGAATEQAMADRARAAGMRLFGPNCQGLANFSLGAVASFSTMFAEIEPADGPVAIISQSGVMSAVPYQLLRDRGVGVRHAHATGNEADVTLAELAAAVVEDPAVRLLLLYLESIRDAPSLVRAAQTAREHDVPIVALKAARTSRGQRAARSHTGALATDDRVIGAFLEHLGIWRVDDPHELVAATELYLKEWRPHRGSLVVVSHSGASGVMAADAASDLNVPLADLIDGTRSRLVELLPSFATVANPVDLTAALLGDNRLLGEVLPVLGGDPAADLFFVGLPVAGPGYDVDLIAGDIARFAADSGKPVVASATQERVVRSLRQAAIPTFANESLAIRALSQLVGHVKLMRRTNPTGPKSRPLSLPPGESRFLSEADSLACLRAALLPVVPYRLCQSGAEAREAFRHFGGPVAVKACSRDLPHKSDHGLVLLGLADEDAAERAFDQLWASLGRLGVTRDGVVVQPMRRGGHECFLGARVDPAVGPVVLMGDGGRYVETLDDYVLLIPPFGQEDAEQAIMTLRVAPRLLGMRGASPLDVAALGAAAVRLGELLAASSGAIASIDLNPVLVGVKGEGVTIIDALIERQGFDPEATRRTLNSGLVGVTLITENG